MNRLHQLARIVGLQIDWEDAASHPQTVSDESLVTILGRLGYAADSPRHIEESFERLEEEKQLSSSAFLTADVGLPISLPPGIGPGRARLVLESGVVRDIEVDEAGALPPIDEAGYHRLEHGGGELTIAVAPHRCFGVNDAAPGRRLWAPAVQIPSLRDRSQQAYGGFGALARLAEAAGRRGADALAISPVHALFPADSTRYSPYAPSTRLFLNVFLADPALLGDSGGSGADAGDLIDWEAAIPARMERLRRLYDNRSDETRRAVEAFRSEGGEELERHARYDALHAHFFSDGARGWQDWPSAFHDPSSDAVALFARQHAEDVGFYVFLQWLADRSLAAAQAAATDNGMAVGLIADLAVGMDGGGSHGWSRRDQLLSGLSVGAPPDKLGPDGQDWGITTFSPRALRRTGFEAFIGTIRAALRHAGGVRIDHALGLRRLWLVPHGASASEGAYLAYPEQDMFRLLALESWRARAIVVGEDLGTVPPGFRKEMDGRGIIGMRVLWFERGADGAFKSPKSWSAEAAAMTGTHDLPTVAGWWRGRDIEWTWKIGRTSSFPSQEAEREGRAEDRERFWQACREAGVATGSAPAHDQPETAVDAAIRYVGETPCEIAIIPAEDLLGLPEQPNLPGTIDEHPNWRRRLPVPVEDMLEAPEVAARIDRLNRMRP